MCPCNGDFTTTASHSQQHNSEKASPSPASNYPSKMSNHPKLIVSKALWKMKCINKSQRQFFFFDINQGCSRELSLEDTAKIKKIFFISIVFFKKCVLALIFFKLFSLNTWKNIMLKHVNFWKKEIVYLLFPPSSFATSLISTSLFQKKQFLKRFFRISMVPCGIAFLSQN